MLYNIILEQKQKQDEMKKQMEKIYTFVCSIWSYIHPALPNAKIRAVYRCSVIVSMSSNLRTVIIPWEFVMQRPPSPFPQHFQI